MCVGGRRTVMLKNGQREVSSYFVPRSRSVLDTRRTTGSRGSGRLGKEKTRGNGGIRSRRRLVVVRFGTPQPVDVLIP